MEYILSTRALCKSYRSCKAVDDLCMHIPKGAIYGFVGENGSGKTTLIRLITGLQPPTGSEYTLYGIKNTDREIAKVRRRIGAVVETPAAYQGMTALENMRQQYTVLGLPDFSGIPELLRLVGLENTADKKVRNFSLGMKQRLGIALALVGDPDFLILDEPTNGLDPQGIIDIRELIVQLNRERQTTVLISSHILSELSRLATHYGFIHKGHMLQEISARQLEEACRKCTRLQVTDSAVLARILEGMSIDYTVLSRDTVDVYGVLNLSSLTLALIREGCEILSLQEKNETLESYYVNLVGGEHHA